MKLVATNRKAKRDYHILDVFEVGIELKGNEVKSLRDKNCSLEDSFARIYREELYLHNMHISEFEKSSYFKTEPKRIRKLLAHKQEIKKLTGLIAQRGFTLVPLRVYFSERGLVKVELALTKGKHSYDKRKKIKDDIVKRESQRALKDAYKKYH